MSIAGYFLCLSPTNLIVQFEQLVYHTTAASAYVGTRAITKLEQLATKLPQSLPVGSLLS